MCHGMSTSSVFSHSVNWVSWLHLAGELVAVHAAVVDMFGAGCGSRLFGWGGCVVCQYIVASILLFNTEVP